MSLFSNYLPEMVSVHLQKEGGKEHDTRIYYWWGVRILSGLFNILCMPFYFLHVYDNLFLFFFCRVLFVKCKITGFLLLWTPLQHKLPTMTHIRKLVYKLRKRTSELMSAATSTEQTTHARPLTKQTNKQ